MGARARAVETAKQGRTLLPLLLLGFALRIYNLAGSEFWFDEALTANVSGLGWQGILAHLRSAPFEHPPLYFLSLYPSSGACCSSPSSIPSSGSWRTGTWP